MASTIKQNFRYSGEKWKQAVLKTEQMRQLGYDIDMTQLLARAVDKFLDDGGAERTAEIMGLEKQDGPVARRYRPGPRSRTATEA